MRSTIRSSAPASNMAIGSRAAVVAVFAVPFQLVILQWFLQRHHTRTVTLYTVGTMAVVAAGWWLVSGAGWQSPGWRGWALIFLLAFVSTYLARILTFMAVRRIGSGQVGLLAPVDTLLTVVWSFLFLGERLTAMQSVGGALILLSASLAIQRLGRVERRLGASHLVE